jgi:hypothetical protein
MRMPARRQCAISAALARTWSMASITASQAGSSSAILRSSMKSSMQATVTVRVDGQDAFAHRQHLGRAQRGAQRLDLAVDVGFGDVVEVDQGQPTDARSVPAPPPPRSRRRRCRSP